VDAAAQVASGVRENVVVLAGGPFLSFI